MNDIEKRARELLAAECRRHGFEFGAYQILEGSNLPPFGAASLNAIIAALTPPDGYVLVQVDQDSVDFYVCDACGHHYMQDGVNCDCIPSSTARPLRHVRMIAARPEVP